MLVYPGLMSAQSRIMSNHSVGLKTNGLEYAYEQALGGDFSIVGHAGIEANLWLDFIEMFAGDNSYNLNPAISIEPRYYYNMARRLRRGKDAGGLSADFISLETKYIFESIVPKNEGAYYPIVISPTWGLRRVWRDKWLLEFNAGLNFYRDKDDTSCGPRLNLKFGFKF